MDIDHQRAERWDQGADDASAGLKLLEKIEPHLEKLNNSVAEVKGQQILWKGMTLATMGMVSIIGAGLAVVEFLSRMGG